MSVKSADTLLRLTNSITLAHVQNAPTSSKMLARMAESS